MDSLAEKALYDIEDNKVELTKLENGFLGLLIENAGEVVNYETIENTVWKGRDMSIYTMRNIINKIRAKTYYEIIKNKSSHGYVVCKK